MTAELPFLELLAILRRRQRLIIATAVIGTLLGFVGALMIPPQYTAKAQIVFESQRPYTGETRQFVGPSEEEAAFQTHITALTSRTFLNAVLNSLSHDSGTGHAQAPAAVVAAGSDDKSAANETLLDKFARRLRVYQEGSSHVITVAFSATAPDAAAVAANRVAQSYIESDGDRKRAEVNRSLSAIDARLPEAKAAFERALLSREGAAVGQVYTGLLQRREQLRAQREMTTPDLRILSLASPPDKTSSPSPVFFIPPSLIVLLIGSSLLAVVLERLDQRLHSVQEVTDALGIPCIGFVPLIRDNGRPRPHEYLLKNRFTAYSEAIRSVITALQLASPAQAPKVILVSSSLPGEGKTMLALSCTVYAALTGRRALLINLDCRLPALSRHARCQATTGAGDNGLLDDLLAEAALQHIPDLNIDYLSLPAGPGEPLRPFFGDSVQRLLSTLRERYDYIVIDGPPVIAVAEARLLATMADKVLLIVRWHSTRRNVARQALNLLREFGPCAADACERVAAVLTQVDLKEHVHRRYGGWEAIRETPEPAPIIAKHDGWRLDVGDPSFVKAMEIIEDPQSLSHARMNEPNGSSTPPMANLDKPMNIESSEMPIICKPTLEKLKHFDIEGLPLPLLIAVLEEFERLNISYCYWKSGLRLPAALSGESDLDLLVSRKDQYRSQAILLAVGFKLFPDAANRSHPAVSTYLGYDEPSGRIIHLHLHFQLVAGEPLLKNYRLPWEAAVLNRATRHPLFPIRVLDPASEAILLVARAAVEPSWKDPAALRHCAAIKRKFERDHEELSARLDRLSLRQQVGEILQDDLADVVVEAVFCATPLQQQRRRRRRMRRELSPHRTYNSCEARLRGWGRAVLWVAGNLNDRVVHAPRSWHRRAPGGGRVVAVVGVDGSGKTTVAAALRAWLGAQIDVMPAYFGTGDGRPSLLLIPIKMMVPLATRVLRTKPKGASHGRVSDRAPGRAYSLLMMVWAAAVAAEKRIKLRAAHRAASRGLVVVADRYPQNEDVEYSDGPLLPRLKYAPRWLRRFEERAYALASHLPPDLVLKLEVRPDTVARRERAMIQPMIAKRINAVHRLAFPGARVVRVDAERPLEDVLRTMKHEIWSVL